MKRKRKREKRRDKRLKKVISTFGRGMNDYDEKDDNSGRGKARSG